jgi:hypothetical protein
VLKVEGVGGVISCPDHSVVTPSRVHSVAIVEGHTDLLRGSCGLCGQTVVGVDTGAIPIRWFPVAEIVIAERRYQRKRLFGGQAAPWSFNPDLAPSLIAITVNEKWRSP